MSSGAQVIWPRQPAVLPNYAYGGFTPSSLGALVRARLTVDDHGTANMTDDGAGLISQWKSTDGSALTITATTTLRPTYSATAHTPPNGVAVPGISFNGANAFVSTTLTNIPTGANAGELWLLFLTTSNLSQTMFGYGTQSASSRRSLQVLGSNGRSRVTDQTVSIDDSISLLGNGGVHVLGGRWQGTTMQSRLNGRLIGSSTIATLATGATRLRLGADLSTSPASFATIIVFEALITDPLSDLQQQQLEAWLLRKVSWHHNRLPATHPFRYFAP
jgi:hypothetical protein